MYALYDPRCGTCCVYCGDYRPVEKTIYSLLPMVSKATSFVSWQRRSGIDGRILSKMIPESFKTQDPEDTLVGAGATE
jgi:hypothetical protein